MNGEIDRCPHAAGIGAAGTRDVQGGAVIGRSAGEWEAESDIHSAAECGDFDGRHANIVVGRQHRVELTAHRPDEDGVGRERTVGAEGARGGREHPVVLISEES
jgi:hypothetical protein